MISVSDMKDLICEWMADATYPAADLARTYAEIMMELEKQLDFCMAALTEEETP